ncbi:hypothetical protein GCM10011344_20600 [Dokdonia pacifica]|uniref:Uncharacterized protein n=1 Tax=Dokdonia pacifica TaxID=1627892 RepID=A0A238VMR3_9FLAO|nr:hypothetical protein [Dokdonia pacifica]GGG19771.1 hypothetical protein GCM10011344_20600 [Dokdonia pacifica]SNR35652.1 hypothetical protein SAMN06265376_10172 [Dokdonia pacifica]
MNFWELINSLISGENQSEITRRQSQIHHRSASPISPDPNIYTYRPKDGSTNYFQFSYHKIGEEKYEIDIHLLPDFKGRSKDIHTIHVLDSPRQARYKVCLKAGHEPKSFQDAQELSKMYAELINIYIKTNVTPDQQIAQQSNN